VKSPDADLFEKGGAIKKNTTDRMVQQKAHCAQAAKR